jgi:uncharacterized protein YecE (DUF72 family)
MILRIGTSGWAYKHWIGRFYPIDLKPDDYLSFYAQEFNTVEINYSFYKLPSEESYINWFQEVGSDFIFAVKGSRYLTHMKKLKDSRDPWQKICDTASCLDRKLGPILMQFPERWKKNTERLHEFLEITKAIDTTENKAGGARLAFEFRDESWFCKEVYDVLEKFGAALCIADSLKFIRKDVVTTDFTYIRYHGRTPIYAANYSKSELRAESKKIQKFLDNDIDVYAYFNNDGEAYAIENARQLKKMLDAQ